MVSSSKKPSPPFLLPSVTLHGIEQMWTIWLSCPGHAYPQLLDTLSLLAAGNVGTTGKKESLDTARAIAKTQHRKNLKNYEEN